MRPTREGRRFLFAFALIGLAALNTGNNLIYLIFSMMLSIFVLAVALNIANLKGLSVSLDIRHPAYAKEAATAVLNIKNSKRHMPSYSVRIGLPEGMKGGCFVDSVPPFADLSESFGVSFEKRGLYSLAGLSLESSFPFIFLVGKKMAKGEGGFLVYPEIRDIGEVLPEIRQTGGHLRTTRRGSGEELFVLRDFAPGDDGRKISWKATAKAEKLIVKEFGVAEAGLFTLILDSAGPPSGEPFERAVSLAASLSKRLLEEGFVVRLVTARKVVPFGGGAEHLFKILDHLAVVEVSESWESPLTEENSGSSLLVLRAGGTGGEALAAYSDGVLYAEEI